MDQIKGVGIVCHLNVKNNNILYRFNILLYIYITIKNKRIMKTIELMKAISLEFNQTKKELTKSFFSGDKKLYNTMIEKFNKMPLSNDVYENINNLSAKYAQSLEY